MSLWKRQIIGTSGSADAYWAGGFTTIHGGVNNTGGYFTYQNVLSYDNDNDILWGYVGNQTGVTTESNIFAIDGYNGSFLSSYSLGISWAGASSGNYRHDAHNLSSYPSKNGILYMGGYAPYQVSSSGYTNTMFANATIDISASGTNRGLKSGNAAQGHGSDGNLHTGAILNNPSSYSDDYIVYLLGDEYFSSGTLNKNHIWALEPDGTVKWQKQLYNGGAAYVGGIATGASTSNIYLAGYTNTATCVFGVYSHDTLTNSTGYQYISSPISVQQSVSDLKITSESGTEYAYIGLRSSLLKVRVSDGSPQWYKRLAYKTEDMQFFNNSLFVLSDGRICQFGSMRANASLPKQYTGSLAIWNPNGTLDKMYQVGPVTSSATGDYVYGRGLVVDSRDNLYLNVLTNTIPNSNSMQAIIKVPASDPTLKSPYTNTSILYHSWPIYDRTSSSDLVVSNPASTSLSASAAATFGASYSGDYRATSTSLSDTAFDAGSDINDWDLEIQ